MKFLKGIEGRGYLGFFHWDWRHWGFWPFTSGTACISLHGTSRDNFTLI